MDHVLYASAIGCLMYAMVCNGPDISHAVGVLRRYMTTLGKEQWKSIKRVFRYLRSMIDFVIFYHGNSKDVEVHAFINSD